MSLADLTRDYLKFPDDTTFMMGATAGRFCSAVILALVPDEPVFVIDEVPNYHYVGDGEIELAGMTTVEWGELVVRMWRFYTHDKAIAWVDEDTDFSSELKRCKLFFRKNTKSPELRIEITREYFHDKRVFFTPWLKILPNEIQRARWPPEESSSGQVRAWGQDYTLNALEHILSRRPTPRVIPKQKPSTYLSKYLAEHKFKERSVDSHLGSH